MAKKPDTYKYLPSAIADHLGDLQISVSKRMDSGLQGQHRSSTFGSSVEFAEYREYMQGDPIERIDWNVYARTDRYVIRRFHDEVNISSNILLDTSESMSFQSAGPMSKMDYSCHLAGALMYVMINQGDSTSLTTFDDNLGKRYEPAATLGGLRPMLKGLEEIVPQGESNIGQALAKATEFFRGRSMVVVISDLLQDPLQTLKGIGSLCYAGHDVTVFHVLDSDEIRLPQEGLIEVEFLETSRKMNVDIDDFRDLYLQRIRQYLDDVRIGCANEGANYILVDTSTDLRDALLRRTQSR
jgi:uncharacterized protein (DUF58 family)